MARTFIRQATQIRRSENYADNLVFGTGLEQSAVTIEDDLNSLRSQLSRILNGAGTGKWYDNVPVVGAAPQGLAQITTTLTDAVADINTIEQRKILQRAQVLTDIVVPATQNFVLLDSTAGEAPTQPAAFEVLNGAVVAAAAAAGHSLVTVVGANALNPKNLVVVRDALTGQPVQSADRDVYGLLQVATGAVEGAAFDNTTTRARLSFVRQNAEMDDFEAVPVADIENREINYSYVLRTSFSSLPEDSFLSSSTFTDLTADVDVTLTRSVANQGATPVVVANDLHFRLANDKQFMFENAAGVSKFAVHPGNGTDAAKLTFDGGALDINNTEAADFSGPVILSSGTSAVRVGVTTGYLDTASANLGIRAGGALYLDDSTHTGSTWSDAAGVKLSGSTTDWTNFATQFANNSLLGAIYQASIMGTRGVKVYATVTQNIAANADAGGTDGGTNLDAQLPSMAGHDFTEDYEIYVNGELMRPGESDADNNDYYPGTSLALGQLKFEFDLRVGDTVCVIPAFKV